MSSFDPAALVRLDSMIAAARYSQDHDKLGDLLVRRADVRLQQGQQPEALNDLREAGQAFLALRDFTREARTHLLRGRLLAGRAGEHTQANDAFNTAAGCARVAANPALYAEILKHHAAATLAAGDFTNAAGLYALQVDALTELGDDAGLADVLMAQGALRHLRGLPHKALDCFDQAVTHARASGDPAKLLHVRLARRAYTAQTVRASSVEPLHELLEEAQGLGLKGPAAVAHLTRASELARLGEHLKAAAVAEQARQAALAGDDPVLYLFSCLLLAECREHLGDRPGVVAILLTCKGTLEDRLGKTAGTGLVMILDSLKGRWGAEALEEALREYRRDARARLSHPESN